MAVAEDLQRCARVQIGRKAHRSSVLESRSRGTETHSACPCQIHGHATLRNAPDPANVFPSVLQNAATAEDDQQLARWLRLSCQQRRPRLLPASAAIQSGRSKVDGQWQTDQRPVTASVPLLQDGQGYDDQSHSAAKHCSELPEHSYRQSVARPKNPLDVPVG